MKGRWIAIALLWIAACTEPYAEFTPADEGCYYRFDKLSSEDTEIDSLSFLVLEYGDCADRDCDSALAKKTLFTGGSLSSICRGLPPFSCGDEFTLLLEGRYDHAYLPGIEMGADSQAYVKVLIAAEIHERRFRGDTTYRNALYAFREKEMIQNYMRDDSLDYRAKSDLKIHVSDTGNGQKVQEGYHVRLRYRGFFLNGKEFDNTDLHPDTFEILYGKPDQMIPGLSAAIFGLRAGAEAKIILPSQLAFGPLGSSTGIIPPHEPVAYQIKILTVK